MVEKSFSEERADQILRFAVAVACRADSTRQRELGPIHLIKFVYLGDLAYAEAHGGVVFTDAPWRFYHYGPWAPQVFNRIPEAMAAAGASQRLFASQYREDNVRWSIGDRGQAEAAERDAERALPIEVALAVAHAVREYGQDTSRLLHAVYQTAPMLQAAPGEELDFRTAMPVLLGEAGGAETGRDDQELQPELNRLPRKTRDRLKALRETVRARLRRPPSVELVPPSPPPRYDAEFFEGLDWLDRLAGEPVEPRAGRISFDDLVWKSEARRAPDDH